MATEIKSGFDFQGRRSKYPWEKWTNGSAWEIRQGDDYTITTPNMQITLHSRATLERKVVRTYTVREGDEVVGIVFQFFSAAPVKAE